MIELKRAFKTIEEESTYRVLLKRELRGSDAIFDPNCLTTELEILVQRLRASTELPINSSPSP